MYSKFRKSGIALMTVSAIMLVGVVPAASAQPNPNASVLTTTNYTFAGTAPWSSTPLNTVPLAQALADASALSANNPYRIVAVGDSLTVGYELGMTATATPYGYADRVYEQALYHGASELTNFGILGLKSAGLAAWLDASAQGKAITAEEAQAGLSKYETTAGRISLTAELKAALTGADLIVMTIGGNDFLPLFSELRSRTVEPAELEQMLATLIEQYKASLEASLRTVYALNPDAKIVLADQYLPVPKPNPVIKVVTDEQYTVLQQGVANLHNALIELQSKFASEGPSLSIIDVSTPFSGKEFLLTSIRDGDVHPNDDGYEVMAKQFSTAIWGSYREAGTLPANVPLHIIVNGKELTGGNKPLLKNNTTFLPIRDVANALGASIAWNNKTQTATVTYKGKEVAFTIGAKTMKVNGVNVPLTTPAFLQNTGKTGSFTYLPLAALSKGLGYQVTYRQPIKTVFINE